MIINENELEEHLKRYILSGQYFPISAQNLVHAAQTRRHVQVRSSVHGRAGPGLPHLRTPSPQLSMPLRLLPYAYLALALATSVAAHPDNSSLQWGPFRPNLYFGVRPRIRETVLMGLMWARVEDDGYIVAQSKFLARPAVPRASDD